MITRHTSLQAVTAIVLFFSFQLLLAAIPSSLNYQGFLTDSSDIPIDGPVSMVFAIYDVETGGTALWSDSLSVTVEQGVLSVELGGTSNPFPAGLFESPLWLGLAVDTDAEMTPRRPISSVGFSFKAGDADTLEGISAATLDQSAHVADTANPHSVTAAQTGAADAATLSTHISNISNPHSVTAAQAGAASSTDFTTHTASSASHHLRYTDVEAIAAMGAKNDSNALHHDKYTDPNAVAAILAADGAGSTLDSDRVDGLEASELIDAAQDEVRTPISSLPYIINFPGSYYLTGDLTVSSGTAGIGVYADHVTIDLMGFSVIHDGSTTTYGIHLAGSYNVTIKNGTVRGFGLAGIYQGGTGASYIKIINVQALGNGTLGTGSSYAGIYLLGSNNLVERCTAGDNGGDGIYTNASSRIVNNTAYNNAGIYGIYGGWGSVLSGNIASSNASTTAAISGGYSSTLIGNIAYNNTGGYGIQGGATSTINGNTAYNNTSTGIYAANGSILNGNTAYDNTGSYGIYGGAGAILTGNIAYYNDNWGMYGAAGNLIKDNTLYSNNQTATAGQGGLRVSNDSRVIGNTLDGNSQNNIVVSSGDCILRDNHVTDSAVGILFTGTGNYYRENTGAGNTTFIDLNGTTQTDGGGNVSF